MKTWQRMGLPRDSHWRQLLNATDPFTMVDRIRRLSILKRIARVEADGVPGCFVECGVAHGGVAALLGVQAQESRFERDLWLFDSFEGLPEPTARDGPEAARFADNRAGGSLVSVGQIVASETEVRKLLFEEFKLDPARVHVVKGWFQETVSSYRGGTIALLHLDGDWYESVKQPLESLWPWVSSGGFVVVDDYGHWEGARRAVREFLGGSGKGLSLHRRGYTQAYFRKK